MIIAVVEKLDCREDDSILSREVIIHGSDRLRDVSRSQSQARGLAQPKTWVIQDNGQIQNSKAFSQSLD
jgi:hypothetical protein